MRVVIGLNPVGCVAAELRGKLSLGSDSFSHTAAVVNLFCVLSDHDSMLIICSAGLPVAPNVDCNAQIACQTDLKHLFTFHCGRMVIKTTWEHRCG